MDAWNKFRAFRAFDELKPVKKFTNRQGAFERIWQAVARRFANAAQPGADVAPAEGKAMMSSAKLPATPRGKKVATESRVIKEVEVITMMKRAKGATMAEIRDRESHRLAKAHGLRPL